MHSDDLIYVLKKDLLDLNDLKTELTNKLNVYKEWFTNFPVNLDMQEKLLRVDLRLTIVEINSELMSLEYKIRDIESELSYQQ
jgi:hypothetical protein